jgi:hypothetical protein
MSINEDTPLAADVYHNGDDEMFGTADDFIPEDWIPVVFRARRGSRITNDSYFGRFLVTHYTVLWSRTDGGTALPAAMDVTGAMNLEVLVSKEAGAAVLVVPFINKTIPEIAPLVGGGEIRAIAHFTFYGYEAISGAEQEISASLAVNFGNFTDAEN